MVTDGAGEAFSVADEGILLMLNGELAPGAVRPSRIPSGGVITVLKVLDPRGRDDCTWPGLIEAGFGGLRSTKVLL